jgi:SSS family solute:Na+ symporter
LPLLTIYAGDKVGAAIIAATTISGTMVMGLAPIFLLSWLPSARALSFHMAFWPGLILGISRAVETFAHITIFPATLALGQGKYALDLGLNVYGLLFCTCGFLIGAVLQRESSFGSSPYRPAHPK